MSMLRQIVESKRREVADRGRLRPLAALRDAERGAPRDFAAALRGEGFAAIGEIKRRSPSRGVLRTDLVAAELARTYERAGAAALSVLTDETFFGGSESDLRAARAAVRLPVLRKDFIIDSYQVYEARAMGADAVLLIVRILDHGALRDLHALTAELGLAALVEVHDERELERAAAVGARLIGVNNRDLDTLAVSLDTCLRLRPRIPAGCIAVAESGIARRADVERLERAGYDAMLVGESLVSSADPAAKLAELLGVSP
ncbi:MAG: indole-3-glycerol phosphate synthase TrpC [Phycisphaerae bacterium]|jgi:indole-3-glycerol phosphate synthase